MEMSERDARMTLSKRLPKEKGGGGACAREWMRRQICKKSYGMKTGNYAALYKEKRERQRAGGAKHREKRKNNNWAKEKEK